jgi:hypothetical protein
MIIQSAWLVGRERRAEVERVLEHACRNKGIDFRGFQPLERFQSWADDQDPVRLVGGVVFFDCITEITPENDFCRLALLMPQVHPVFIFRLGNCPPWLSNNFLLYSRLHVLEIPRDAETVLPLSSGAGSALLGQLALIFEHQGASISSLFDPTGLRATIRKRLLAKIGIGVDSDQSIESSRQLGQAINIEPLAVVIDSDLRAAAVSCYALYRLGYRVLPVLTASGLKKEVFEEDGLVATELRQEALKPNEVNRFRQPLKESKRCFIIRDRDLRFQDWLPEDLTREQLQWIQKWPASWQNDRLLPRCRVLSQEPLPPWTRWVRSLWASPSERRRGRILGESSKARYWRGLEKPMRSLRAMRKISPVPASRLLEFGRWDEYTPHHAPYLNLPLVNNLLLLARRCRANTSTTEIELVLGGILAHEAFALLRGINEIASLESVRELTLCEIRMQTRSLFLENSGGALWRARELSQVVSALTRRPRDREPRYMRGSYERTKRSGRRFLTQLWSEVRSEFQSAGDFKAADMSLRESLVMRVWSPGGFWAQSRLWYHRVFFWMMMTPLGAICGLLLACSYLAFLHLLADWGSLSSIRPFKVDAFGRILSATIEDVFGRSGVAPAGLCRNPAWPYVHGLVSYLSSVLKVVGLGVIVNMVHRYLARD